MSDLPYFDLILDGRKRGEPASEVFERFVHWGFWAQPAQAEGGERDFLAAMERLNEEVLRAAELSGGQAVLDAGCGFGGSLGAIDAAYEGMALTGLNIDPRQLELARAKVRARPGNSLVFVEGDACALPFPDGAFDRVLAVECIFHFPSRQTFLREAARVLKPGGRLALSDFVPFRVGGAAAWPGRWLEGRIAAGYGTLGSGWIDGDYAAMARAAGLEPVLDRDITRETLPTYPILLKLLQRGSGELSKRLLWPTRLLRWLSISGIVRYRVLAFRKPY